MTCTRVSAFVFSAALLPCAGPACVRANFVCDISKPGSSFEMATSCSDGATDRFTLSSKPDTPECFRGRASSCPPECRPPDRRCCNSLFLIAGCLLRAGCNFMLEQPRSSCNPPVLTSSWLSASSVEIVSPTIGGGACNNCCCMSAGKSSTPRSSIAGSKAPHVAFPRAAGSDAESCGGLIRLEVAGPSVIFFDSNVCSIGSPVKLFIGNNGFRCAEAPLPIAAAAAATAARQCVSTCSVFAYSEPGREENHGIELISVRLPRKELGNASLKRGTLCLHASSCAKGSCCGS
mmetsp:Transcript_67495/g.112216  ORF Transcript_67495/g.112216 Transcript_67495/m.112216 type:complete len:291 (+) Transcript_67495:586-1458(+)